MELTFNKIQLSQENEKEEIIINWWRWNCFVVFDVIIEEWWRWFREATEERVELHTQVYEKNSKPSKIITEPNDFSINQDRTFEKKS